MMVSYESANMGVYSRLLFVFNEITGGAYIEWIAK